MHIIVNVKLEELIYYSKKEDSPPITIIDKLKENELEYAKVVANRLRVNIIQIADTKMIAVVGYKNIALKLAKELNKKCQYMFYDLIKRPSTNLVMYALTGYTNGWTILRDNGYVVESYNENGEKIDNWINTNINDIDTTTISELDFKNHNISLQVRGCGSSRRSNERLLELSRYNYINDGVFNKERQCYYPSEIKTNKGIANYNRLEKLFNKWGFKSL